MSSIRDLTASAKSNVQELNLESSRTLKIYVIDSLQRFTNLKSLVLSNNMISKIQNINHLQQLRILNLEFNQIAVLENIEGLTQLQELFLSYNCIEVISADLQNNSKLQVLHLAYNDFKTINDIHPLSCLNLTILSVFGNPFLASLNYITLMKMLMPTLVVLDDKDANECAIMSQVYPQEEIIILRETLNKLMDERNEFAEAIQAQHQSSKAHDSIFAQDRHSSQQKQIQKANYQDKDQSDFDQFVDAITYWITKNQRKTELKKQQINKLTDVYANKLKHSQSRHKKMEDFSQCEQLVKKIHKYSQKLSKGLLNQTKIMKLAEMKQKLQIKQHELEAFIRNEKSHENQVTNCKDSKNMLSLLKEKQIQYTSCKLVDKRLKQLRQQVLSTQTKNINKFLLFKLLFGQIEPRENDYNELRKYLVQSHCLSDILTKLQIIIFGSTVTTERIINLKQFLQHKNLIQIINELKDLRIKDKQQKIAFENEKKKIMDQLEASSKLICQEWKSIEQQKKDISINTKESRKIHFNFKEENAEEINNKQILRKDLEDKYQRLENDEREKILRLKKQKEYYENKVEELIKSNQSLNFQYSRKFNQLEEFENYFEDFKREKQVICDLKAEIEQVKVELLGKKNLLAEICQQIKENSLSESINSEKLKFVERKCYQKHQELKQVSERFQEVSEKSRRLTEEVNFKSFQILKLDETIEQLREEEKERSKKNERQKNTLQMYEEKLRNLSELELCKKNAIKSLQIQIQEEKKQYLTLNERNIDLEEKVIKNTESLYQYQLKVQQNKKHLESLADINNSVSEMIQRQSQLKRAIIELEIEKESLEDAKALLEGSVQKRL